MNYGNAIFRYWVFLAICWGLFGSALPVKAWHVYHEGDTLSGYAWSDDGLLFKYPQVGTNTIAASWSTYTSGAITNNTLTGQYPDVSYMQYTGAVSTLRTGFFAAWPYSTPVKGCSFAYACPPSVHPQLKSRFGSYSGVLTTNIPDTTNIYTVDSYSPTNRPWIETLGNTLGEPLVNAVLAHTNFGILSCAVAVSCYPLIFSNYYDELITSASYVYQTNYITTNVGLFGTNTYIYYVTNSYPVTVTYDTNYYLRHVCWSSAYWAVGTNVLTNSAVPIWSQDDFDFKQYPYEFGVPLGGKVDLSKVTVQCILTQAYGMFYATQSVPVYGGIGWTSSVTPYVSTFYTNQVNGFYACDVSNVVLRDAVLLSDTNIQTDTNCDLPILGWWWHGDDYAYSDIGGGYLGQSSISGGSIVGSVWVDTNVVSFTNKGHLFIHVYSGMSTSNLVSTVTNSVTTNNLKMSIMVSSDSSGVLVAATGGQPGGTFVLENTSDLVSFTPAFTNSFDSSGSCAFSIGWAAPYDYQTNIVAAGQVLYSPTDGSILYTNTVPTTNIFGQLVRFYRIKVP